MSNYRVEDVCHPNLTKEQQFQAAMGWFRHSVFDCGFPVNRLMYCIELANIMLQNIEALGEYPPLNTDDAPSDP